MNHTMIASIRLANQQLSNTDFTAPQQVVSWMGAMQAQDFNMAKWAVGIRITGCTDKIVEEAFNKGEILRTHVLRPTWHFVVPENIRWMLQLTAPRIISSMKSRDRDLGLTGEYYVRGNQIIQKALEGNKHLTREELAKVFDVNHMVVNSSQLSHLVMHAELDGLICSGVVKGKKQTYALLDERVAPTKSLHKDEALAKLAGIYFTSHGPASLQDFVWWSGLSVTEAREGLELIKEKLVSGENGLQVYWMSNSFHQFPGEYSGMHLLPAFDEYIISYRDRSAVLPQENYYKAVSDNGIFRPTIMRNGQVIGIWKKSNLKSKTIIPVLFVPAEESMQNLISQAEEKYKVFLKH